MIRTQQSVPDGTSRPLTEPDDAEEDSSDDDQVLEESPCGRWQKRKDEVRVHARLVLRLIIKVGCTSLVERLQVTQKDVPGIDATYLAMDTEEGVEVVWNEMKFSERKDFRKQKVNTDAPFSDRNRCC